ncbi:hypothetical protein MRX96_049759, partial [Rhipicephalus microplus]
CPVNPLVKSRCELCSFLSSMRVQRLAASVAAEPQ